MTLPLHTLTSMASIYKCANLKCGLRFLQNLDFEGPRIPIKVVVGVDKPSPLLSQLFQTLDIGSIQDLMTLPLHTLTSMASIYKCANLNVG